MNILELESPKKLNAIYQIIKPRAVTNCLVKILHARLIRLTTSPLPTEAKPNTKASVTRCKYSYQNLYLPFVWLSKPALNPDPNRGVQSKTGLDAGRAPYG